MKRTGPMNAETIGLLRSIRDVNRKEKVPFWKALIGHLEKSARRRAEVNIGKLNMFSGKETLVVPGKVLSMGNITKVFEVAALAYSDGAKAKMDASKIKYMSLDELLKKNPKAKAVKIII